MQFLPVSLPHRCAYLLKTRRKTSAPVLAYNLTGWSVLGPSLGDGSQLLIFQKEANHELGTSQGQLGPGKRQSQEMWGDITDQELDVIEGKREELVGQLQAKYGYTKEKAEEQADDWVRKL
ncbi:MAG: CsbD family protein [Gammaproteobacteria bacterium]